MRFGVQVLSGTMGHFWSARATSARLVIAAVAPLLPVSTGATMGNTETPAGGYGLLYGLPLYFAVPPPKIQSHPLRLVTAW